MRGTPDVDGLSVSYGQSFVRECLEAVLVEDDSYEEPVEVDTAGVHSASTPQSQNVAAAGSSPATPKVQVAKEAASAGTSPTTPKAQVAREVADSGSADRGKVSPAARPSPPQAELPNRRRDLHNRIYAPPKLPCQWRRPLPNSPLNIAPPTSGSSSSRHPRYAPPTPISRPVMPPTSVDAGAEDNSFKPWHPAVAPEQERADGESHGAGSVQPQPPTPQRPEPRSHVAPKSVPLRSRDPKSDFRPISRLLKEAKSDALGAEAQGTLGVLQGALNAAASSAATVKKAPELRLPALPHANASHIAPHQPSSFGLPLVGLPQIDLNGAAAGGGRYLLPEPPDDSAQPRAHRVNKMPLFLRMQRNYELQELEKEAAVREERLRQLAVHAIPAPRVVVRRAKKKPKAPKRRRMKRKNSLNGDAANPYESSAINASDAPTVRRRGRKEKRGKHKKGSVVPVLTEIRRDLVVEAPHDPDTLTGWEVTDFQPC